jgi:formylglycine-generating enzyme required for sulfatase activity
MKNQTIKKSVFLIISLLFLRNKHRIKTLRISKLIILYILIVLLGCKNYKDTQPNIKGMIEIPKGILHMGGDNDQADENEFPKHHVEISSFFLDETEVTNSQFMEFVQATGYKTVAERPVNWEEMKKQLPEGTLKPHDSILQPGALVFTSTKGEVPLNNPSLWWRWTKGANWRHPQGPSSSIDNILDHPVVQIAWEDADAYCKWRGKRLPTEAEWEWAARGGKEDNIYPWGNETIENSFQKANFYQGLFPVINQKLDGYERTAPVKTYPKNGYNLYDMAGNVWEWCHDWYSVEYYSTSKASEKNNRGPLQSYNPSMPFQKERVIRGGSFLCSESYCSGYRNSRRMGSTPDTGLDHTGCRCAKSK